MQVALFRSLGINGLKVWLDNIGEICYNTGRKVRHETGCGYGYTSVQKALITWAAGFPLDGGISQAQAQVIGAFVLWGT